MQQNSHYSESSWFRQGLLFGLLLGLIEFIFWVITKAILGVPLRSVVQFFSVILLSFVGGLLIGLRVSRQTGKMRAGLLAGLLTGLVAGMVFIIASFVYSTAQLNLTGYRVNPLLFLLSPAAPLFIGQSVLPATLFGCVGGLIGGAVGRAESHYRA